MRLKTGTAFLLMLCLAVFALCYGAYRGWSEERALVNETYAGLESKLHTRVESAYNVLTVAARHLENGDPLMQKVRGERDTLEGSASLREKAAANEKLTADAGALLDALRALPSVQQDSRDLNYVEHILPQMLEQSRDITAGASYNRAAKDFNERLNGSFSGWLARLLGVQPAEEFGNP